MVTITIITFEIISVTNLSTGKHDVVGINNAQSEDVVKTCLVVFIALQAALARPAYLTSALSLLSAASFLLRGVEMNTIALHAEITLLHSIFLSTLSTLEISYPVIQ